MTHNNCQSLRAPGANGPEHREPDVSLMIVNTWWQHGSNMQHACWPHMLRANKQKLGQFCSDIRSKRPPEPFKGKGIRYADEYIIRKEGKKK